MLTVSSRNQIIIGVVLGLAMAATRSHHFANVHHLPDASWAMFFLAGVYLRPWQALPGLLALVFGIDFMAFQQNNDSAACFTPAYAFILPALASLWLAGRWYAGRYQFAWRTFAPLSMAVLVGALVCEFWASGGYYLFSGYFQPTFSEFSARMLEYFPADLQTMIVYLGLTVLIHAVLTLARQRVAAIAP